MTLREKIAPDLPMIDEYLHTYGSSSAMPAARYLEDWEDAKGDYLEGMFGDELILRKPVSYKKSPEILSGGISSVRTRNYEDWNYLQREIKDLICFVLTKNSSYYNMFGYGATTSEEWRERNEGVRRFISYIDDDLLSLYDRDMAANSISKKFIFEPSEDNYLKQKFQVQQGAKPFRLLHRILTTFQPLAEEHEPMFDKDWLKRVLEAYEILRCKVSEVLHDKLIQGMLTLSIHPMDFLTMSDNDYGWDSCMTWTRDDCPGEYHAGTLEMLNSRCIVVAYLDGDKEYRPLNNYRWSNKKWRELFIVDRNFIAGICGYPFQLADAETDVLNWLADLAERAGYPAYSREVVSNDTYSFTIGEKESNFYTKVMYNDTDYHGTRMLKTTYPDMSKFREEYWYGGMARCICCGEPLTDYDHADSVCCGECRGDFRCASCGDWLDTDDTYTRDEEGNYFCADCSEVCQGCDDYFPPNTLQSVSLFFQNNGSRLTHEAAYLCDCCRRPLEPYIFKGSVPDILRTGYWSQEWQNADIIDGSINHGLIDFLFENSSISWSLRDATPLTKEEILQQATA